METLADGVSGADFSLVQRESEDPAVQSMYSSHLQVLTQLWGLKPGGALFDAMQREGFDTSEEIVEAVIRSFWRRLHDQPVELPAQALRTREVRRLMLEHVAVLSGVEAAAAVHPCSRRPPTFDDMWVPDEDALRGVEEAAVSALTRLQPPPIPDVIVHGFSLSPRDYYFQSVGIVTRGRKLIYVNDFTGRSSGSHRQNSPPGVRPPFRFVMADAPTSVPNTIPRCVS